MTTEEYQIIQNNLQEIAKILGKEAVSQPINFDQIRQNIPQNEFFLKLLYSVILDREIDPTGLSGWLNQLENGLSRSRLIEMLIDSSEFYQKILREMNMNQILIRLHAARVEMVKTLLPPAKTVLDIGGYSQSDKQGALLCFGYPYPLEELYIVDLHPDQMMFPGPHWPEELQHDQCQIKYVYSSMTDLSSFPKGYFDLIWSGESIEHITQKDAEKVLDQAYGLLKPGGKLALDTPNRRATKILNPNGYIHPEHKIEYYYRDLCRLVEKHGFKIIQSKGILDVSKSILSTNLNRGLLNFEQECLTGDYLNDNPDYSYCFYICCIRSED